MPLPDGWSFVPFHVSFNALTMSVLMPYTYRFAEIGRVPCNAVKLYPQIQPNPTQRRCVEEARSGEVGDGAREISAMAC